ncbi:unnamed protein product [Phaeothamnion confervicola]
MPRSLWSRDIDDAAEACKSPYWKYLGVGSIQQSFLSPPPSSCTACHYHRWLRDLTRHLVLAAAPWSVFLRKLMEPKSEGYFWHTAGILCFLMEYTEERKGAREGLARICCMREFFARHGAFAILVLVAALSPRRWCLWELAFFRGYVGAAPELLPRSSALSATVGRFGIDVAAAAAAAGDGGTEPRSGPAVPAAANGPAAPGVSTAALSGTSKDGGGRVDASVWATPDAVFDVLAAAETATTAVAIVLALAAAAEAAYPT